jgi:tetratricopeptide (TPR) repeat protein
MSRFTNLELGDDSEKRSSSSAGLTDEMRFLADADAAFASGRFNDALRWFARVLEFNAANSAAWTGQVRALIELGEFREASTWADKAMEKFPREPELLAAKGVAVGRLGDLDAAAAFSDAAFDERRETPYLWLARGDVFLARRDSAAEGCIARALEMASGQWLFAWLAARVRMFHRQFAVGLKHVRQALELNPTNPLLWAVAADCENRIGLVQAAEASLARAFELDPHNEEARNVRHELGNPGTLRRVGGWLRQKLSK